MRGDVREKALGLLEPLYEAEFVTDGWSVFLQQLMEAMESDVAIAVTLDRRAQPLEFLTAGVFDQPMTAAYQAHFAAVDPWAEAFLTSRQPFGKNVCSQELLDPRLFEQTEYYNDFWRPNHDLFHTCGALIEVDGGFANVGFPRCRDRGAYDASDIAFLDVMAHHIGAALRMHQRFIRANKTATQAEAALDQMQSAMLIADNDGSIVYANPAAEAELAAGMRLSSRNGRLMAGKLIVQADFERAFRAAAGVSERITTRAPIALASEEADPASRASITFHPLPTRARDPMALRRPGVLVVVSEARSAHTIPASLLRALFGVTPAEARVAQLLCVGHGLEEICNALNIGKGTARTHLKHLFQRTGTKRQSQLVSLLNRIGPKIVD